MKEYVVYLLQGVSVDVLGLQGKLSLFFFSATEWPTGLDRRCKAYSTAAKLADRLAVNADSSADGVAQVVEDDNNGSLGLNTDDALDFRRIKTCQRLANCGLSNPS